MPLYRVGIIGLSEVVTSPPATPAPHSVLGTLSPYTHAAALAQSHTTELVAICDLIPASRELFRTRWQTRWPELKYYDDYRAMLAEMKLDILCICTPDHLHADMVVAACEAGVKGIICEKPIATTLRDAERMIAATQKHGVHMSVEHTRRWIYEFHAARKLVREGQIGALQRIVGTLNGERAMLFRNGTHLVDLICFFAESAPAWVIGILDADFDQYGPRYAGDGGRDPKTDPGAVGIIHFQNGVRALYQGSQETVGHFSLDLIGNKGRLHLGVSDHQFEISTPGAGMYDLVHRTMPRLHTTQGALGGVIEEMAHLLTHGGESVSPAHEAVWTLSILLGFLQSHHQGNLKITLPLKDM